MVGAYGARLLFLNVADCNSSPPRHSQLFNGGFIISITFDHKLAKFGMYILSCVSQQTNLWLRLSEFLLSRWQTSCRASWICVLRMLLLSCIHARWSCRIFFNKSPGHIKQSGLKEVYSILLSLCVSCPITTSEHKEATAACVVRRQCRYSKKKKIYNHILLITVSANWQSVCGCKTSTTEEKPVWPILLLPILFYRLFKCQHARCHIQYNSFMETV